MNNNLKFALVTGAGRGIGKKIAHLLAKNKIKILINDVSETAEKTSEEFLKEGLESCCYIADISVEHEVVNMFDFIEANYGKIDILINNAGISPKSESNKKTPIVSIGASEWDQVMNVNLKGVYLCSKYAAKMMKKNKFGKIVNIASVMGKIGCASDIDGSSFPVSTSGAHYCVSKAGVICLTKCLAKELAEYNINVNAVAPGAVSDGMGKFDKTLIERLKQQIPLKRLATYDDIAKAVLFLVSQEASYITGEILDVNGGWLMD